MEKEKPSYGSLVSILLVVIVLIAGAWYVWHKRVMEMYPQPAPQAQAQ